MSLQVFIQQLTLLSALHCTDLETTLGTGYKKKKHFLEGGHSRVFTLKTDKFLKRCMKINWAIWTIFFN